MARKNMLNVVLSLKDRFTKPLKKTTKTTKAMEKELTRATKRVKAFGTRANNSFKSITKSAGRMTAAFAGISVAGGLVGLKSFGSEAVEAAKAQVEAETKLNAVLGNVKSISAGGADSIKAAKDRLVGVAGDIQKVGVIGDEVTIAGQQQLATFQLSADSIETLTVGMTDLLAQQKGLNATQQDAVSIGNLIGKAMSGQASALSRVGIIMTDNQKKMLETGDETQKAAVLAQVLKDNVGGVNKALAQTDQGAIQQFSNNWGDMTEQVGTRLLKMKAKLAGMGNDMLPALQDKLIGFLDKAVDNFDPFMAKVEAMKPKLVNLWHTVESVGGGLLKAVKPFFSFLLNKPELAIKGLIGIGGAFAGFNAVTGIIGKVLTFKQGISDVVLVAGHFIKHGGAIPKVLSGITGGVKLLTTAIKANPIGFIISLIIAVIGWLVHLYQTNETFRNKVNAVFAAVKNAVVKAVGAVKAKFDQFKAGLQQIKDKVVSMKNSVVNAFQAIHDKISSTIQKIRDKIQGLLDKLNIFKRESTDSSMSSGLNNLISRANGQASHGRNALGTSYWKGGPTSVNEGGRGEIINLPSGTQVIPHDVAKKAGGNTSISVQVTVQGNVIGDEAFANRVGNIIAKKVAAAAANS